jgi:hypothetical protein
MKQPPRQIDLTGIFLASDDPCAQQSQTSLNELLNQAQRWHLMIPAASLDKALFRR